MWNHFIIIIVVMVLITEDWGRVGQGPLEGKLLERVRHASGEETGKCGQHFQFCYQGNRGPVLEQVMELKTVTVCLLSVFNGRYY